MVRHLQQCRVKERGIGLQWYQSTCQARSWVVGRAALSNMQGVSCQRLGSTPSSH